MSTALDAVLSDYGSALEITCEIDSARRDDGTLKTWYFSTHIRSTGASDSPANTDFLPFLLNGIIGPLAQSLSEDLTFSGLAENSPGSITLVQTGTATDELSEMNDYVFAGYAVKVKIGREGEDYDNFITFRTTTIAIDPVVTSAEGGIEASFQLAGALTRTLEENLLVKRHVGIPTCAEVLTTSAVASTTYNAAHDVTTFTIVYRVLIASLPAAARNLIAKTSGSTNANFVINVLTSGWVECQASLGGVSNILHASGYSIVDSEYHTIVWSLLDKTTSYLMIDGVVINTLTSLSASVDLPAVGVRMARFLVGKHSGIAIFNRYMTPDEAAGISAVRIDGTELGCVACWRMDDGGSATAANDYSSTGADATWTGVLNTDYQWTFTDLGEPELAGTLYPVLAGNVRNATAQLIDASRKRYRGNVDAVSWYQSGINLDLTVRSQGTVLTGGGVDYTAPADGGDGVFSTTSQESEPVTFDLLNNGTGEYNYYPAAVAYSLLTNRTRITGSQIKNVDPLSILCPWPSGYWTNQDSTARDALSHILGNAGLHYYEDALGNLFFNFLLPPTGYGPYGEPCLDLRGGQSNRVVWGDLADITGSCTVCCWLKVNVLDQTAYNWGAAEPNQGTMFAIQKGGLPGNYALWFQAVGADAGKLKFRTAGTTLATPTGTIYDSAWYFVAGVFDDTANTMKIYVGRKSDNPLDLVGVVEVASGANTGTQSTNSNGIMIGDSGARFPWISVQHAQVWSAAKTKAQLDALALTPPVGNESGLLFYAPVNEGAGNPIDLVSGTAGTITTADPLDPNGQVPQWSPKLVVNLDNTPSVRLTAFHHTHPASEIIVKYAKNYTRMAASDIDTGVSQNDRLSLTREGLEVRLYDQAIKDRFPSSGRVILDSALSDQESAQRLLQSIKRRVGDDVYTGVLEFPPDLNISRLACGLEIGDEIGIFSSIPSQLQAPSILVVGLPRSFRVVAVAPNPLTLSTTVVIFG